jgi:hypothetical protein
LIVLLGKDGIIYSFGNANDGKLGLVKKSRGNVNLPSKVKTSQKCIDIACGLSSTTLLVQSGEEIITMGKTAWQQNHNRENRGRDHFQSFPLPVKFVNISGGTNHLAAISTGGKCYTWGLSQNGRLGHGDKNKCTDDIVSHPKQVDYFSTINLQCNLVKVVCGGAHTSVLSEDGRLFSFGWNEYYQCGIDSAVLNSKSNIDMYIPKEVHLEGRSIFDVSCGFAHTVAIDMLGNLFVWGFNEEGQLGLGHEQLVKEPTKVLFQHEFDYCYTVAVSAGKTHTACIKSICSPHEFMNRLSYIKKKQKAVDILSRFFNHTSIQLRHIRDIMMNTLDDNENNNNEDVKQPVEISDDETSTCHSTVMSIIASEEDDIDSPCSTHDNTNINVKGRCSQFEMQLMALEDERSRRLANMENKRTVESMKKKRRVANEILRRYECLCMFREDQYSFAFQRSQKANIQNVKNQTFQQKDTTKIQSFVDQRNIKKTQLPIVKIQKQQPKSLLPLPRKVKQLALGQRRTEIRKYTTAPKVRLRVIEDPASLNPIHNDPSNSEYNKILIKRREKRLVKEEICKKNMQDRHKQMNDLRKIKSKYFSEKAINEALQCKVKMHGLISDRINDRRSELIDMKQDLMYSQLRDKENSSYKVRTVTQWSSDLT